MEFTSDIHKQIWKLRKTKGLTQVEVAKQLGHANSSTLSRIEAGKFNVSVKLANEILSAINAAYKQKLLNLK